MKCCVQDFIDKNNLKKHYSNQHRINSKNYFFKALIEKNNENVTDVMI